jgi:hypothetical protein
MGMAPDANAAEAGAAPRVTRDVQPAALQDLLDHPPRATVAFVEGGAVTLLPVTARYGGGTHRFGLCGAVDLDGREVVLLRDDGAYWFELRGISVRGVAARDTGPAPDTADGTRWYAVQPRRVLAWDYATIRHV